MNMQNTNERPKKTISEIFAERTLIDWAAREGVRQALLRHKLLGQSVVVWENGQIVTLTPDKITVSAEPEPKPGEDPIPARRAV
jgi:hypothetical protein